MARDVAALISTAVSEVRAASAAAKQHRAALSRATDALNAVDGALHDARIAAQPAASAPPTDHRRAHRPGRPAKLDTDAELRAFVLARIDRLTFEEIAAEIALQFPLKRRVGRSTIHHWWRKNEDRYTTSGNPAE